MKGKSIITKNDLISVKELISKQNKKLDKEEDIQHRTNKIQKAFFSNIQIKHPALTNSDLKILSYLIIELDTKEIAIIMGMSIDAIRKRRHRIRKKNGIIS